jgi:hypothetical protein
MNYPDFEKFSLYDETARKINQESLYDRAFSVTFTWRETSITVKLDNGEDVLKLAQVFSNALTNSGIPNTLTNEK